MKHLLEIAVFNIQSALTAANGGADRIELCENYNNGGTTPSYGILKTIREKVSIPAFVMVCPRAGDFLYNEEEYEVIRKDIQLAKDLGFNGVVCGILNKDGSIDRERTAPLVELAYPLAFTFHRAFDRCREPMEALETIISCGCDRILTSGQQPNVYDGRELIRKLIKQANERITILVGGGLRSTNVQSIKEHTEAVEFHTSAKKTISSVMEYVHPYMKDDTDQVGVDIEEIRKIKSIIHEYP